MRVFIALALDPDGDPAGVLREVVDALAGQGLGHPDGGVVFHPLPTGEAASVALALGPGGSAPHEVALASFALVRDRNFASWALAVQREASPCEPLAELLAHARQGAVGASDARQCAQAAGVFLRAPEPSGPGDDAEVRALLALARRRG